ncbi:MAG: HAMP domain-containing histidine kinase [Lachnospiraceae bacterium]|nr:HAMP domain-containing histidine kinase [Lachnospiraceae bacterium]
MFKKLHIQLTFFCTLVSGVILVFMSLICLFFSETEANESHFSDFQININMLVNHLENESVLSHNWLSQFHADTHFEMNIRDNGSSLIFETLSPLSLEHEIFEEVRQKAQTDYGILEEAITSNSVLSIHNEFHLTYQGQDYYAAIALIPKNNSVINAAVLYPSSYLDQNIRFQRFLFMGADILGIALLAVFFWFFTWRMIQPLLLSRQKQAEFIAAASHELRSPLAVMLSSLSAMKHASPEETAHFSETIETEGKRMSRLIEDMLTLSHTDSSHFAIQKTKVELDTLLLSTYEKFEPLALKKSISFGITLPEEGIPPCLCDKERIEQVLSILMDNALSYTPSHGKISLSLKISSDRFTFRVTDNGPGIPDSEKESIFDRFYRCDKSHKDKSHFGLGLCIAQEIIHIHKGKLYVEDAPEGGASFVVVLPRL